MESSYLDDDYVGDFRLETDQNEGYLNDTRHNYMIQIETTNEGQDGIERRIRWEHAEERLGYGSFGCVRKELDEEGNVRAVKRVDKAYCKPTDIDYGRELLAMAKLSGSRNIFVAAEQPSWWIKIGDFGNAKRVRPGDLSDLESEVGTPAFRAPEIVEEEPPYTKKVDIWNLGCVVYWILTQKHPFSGSQLHEFYHTGARFPIEHLDRHCVSKEGIAFLKKSLAMKPEDRPSASQALEDPWISPRSVIASLVSNVGRSAATVAQDGVRLAVPAQRSERDNASNELVLQHLTTINENDQQPNLNARVEPLLKIAGQDGLHLAGTTKQTGGDDVSDKPMLPHPVATNQSSRHSSSVDKKEPFVGTVLQTDLHLTGTTRQSEHNNASDHPLLSQSAMTNPRDRHQSSVNKEKPVGGVVLQNGLHLNRTPRPNGSDKTSDEPMLSQQTTTDRRNRYSSSVSKVEHFNGKRGQVELRLAGAAQENGSSGIVQSKPPRTNYYGPQGKFCEFD